jgi:hypothetical protein
VVEIGFEDISVPHAAILVFKANKVGERHRGYIIGRCLHRILVSAGLLSKEPIRLQLN